MAKTICTEYCAKDFYAVNLPVRLLIFNSNLFAHRHHQCFLLLLGAEKVFSQHCKLQFQMAFMKIDLGKQVSWPWHMLAISRACEL